MRVRVRSGQAMFLSVFVIGSTILGATTIAGLLMIYQIRRSTDLANSAKAIFAADAGLESVLYNKFGCDPSAGICEVNVPVLSLSGARVSVECFDLLGVNPVDCYNNPNSVSVIRSIGRSANSYRAFVQRF